MLTRGEVKEKLKEFETNCKNFDGILLFIPVHQEFCAIAFGDGSNSDSLEDDCDDYIYINCYKFEDLEFIETDGGQLDFNSELAGFNQQITNAVYDALKFMYDFVPDFIPLQNFMH